MKKISIKKKDGHTLVISYYIEKAKVNENNTNIINIDNMYFTDLYIEKNVEMMREFMSSLTSESEITKIIVIEYDLASLVLNLIINNKDIKSFQIKENKEIDYEVFNFLSKSKYIKEIDVYSMKNFMFDKLAFKEKKEVNLRYEILPISNFMEINKLTKYSLIYYKKSIVIKEKLLPNDLKDLELFFQINNMLRSIHFVSFDLTIVKDIMEVIKKMGKKNLLLKIYHTGHKEDDVRNKLDKFKEENKEDIKKYKLRFKIVYNKSYREKYEFKQMNINIFRLILLSIVGLSSLSIFIYSLKSKQAITGNLKATNDLLSLKKEILKEDSDTKDLVIKGDKESEAKYLKAYYKKYDKVFTKLKNINRDTVGWLTVNNTKIDYPVVQGKNNEYYLKHNFYNDYSVFGWIFMDYRNDSDLNDQNTIIYGHEDSTRHLMFTTLQNTINPSWYKDTRNHLITYNTLNKINYFQVFSLYVIDVTNDYLITNYKNIKNYEEFLNKIKGRSIYDFGVNLDGSDHILTLSTCFKNGSQRVVLHAKLVK